ncbi:hypothetical protein QSU92_01245 [Microbacterium sp. ET2]|uniref:hypothetical protein n=1 Tax=Microbacterium albipurpureum TaxID=3050384 RepID=UPI00259CB061|nr:hypothetical protein [Microbacterium sp. ET2 (Ac-2212)]WJL95881.1 hypothetical protein QSU92_01245 [Microbacterium sp. ET2 (Ac-2212)]
MSLDALEKQLDEIRDRAEREKNSHWGRIKQIDADAELSDEGKKAQRDRFAESARERLRALRAEEEARVDAKISELERRLDGATGTSSTDVIAFRDAQDRAERLDDADDAKRMLDRALRSNDKSLAFAIFRRALDANWRGLVADFTTAQPQVAGVAQDLEVLYRHRANTMARTLVYGLLGS